MVGEQRIRTYSGKYDTIPERFGCTIGDCDGAVGSKFPEYHRESLQGREFWKVVPHVFWHKQILRIPAMQSLVAAQVRFVNQRYLRLCRTR